MSLSSDYFHRCADGAEAFAARLAEGQYPSMPLPDGPEGTNIRDYHDRHVLIHARNYAAILREAADRIAFLEGVALIPSVKP